MSGTFSDDDVINWFPYASQSEASFCLSRFISKALSPNHGIVWCSPSGCILLREAKIDHLGFSSTIIIQWQNCLPPLPDIYQEPLIYHAPMDPDLLGADLDGGSQQTEGTGWWESAKKWFENPDHENFVSTTLDVIGLIQFGLLFVPIVGEVEMAGLAFSGAIRLGAELAAKRVITSRGAAGAGAMLSAIVDGKYMVLRYTGDEDVDVRRSKAKAWVDSPTAQTMLIASALLGFKDLAVTTVMTPGKLKALIKDRSFQKAFSVETTARAITTAESGGGHLRQAAQSKGLNRVEQTAEGLQKMKEANYLKSLAKAADQRATEISDELHKTLLLDPFFIGTGSLGETLIVHDTADYARQFVADLLWPSDQCTLPPPGHFIMQPHVKNANMN